MCWRGKSINLGGGWILDEGPFRSKQKNKSQQFKQKQSSSNHSQANIVIHQQNNQQVRCINRRDRRRPFEKTRPNNSDDEATSCVSFRRAAKRGDRRRTMGVVSSTIEISIVDVSMVVDSSLFPSLLMPSLIVEGKEFSSGVSSCS